MEKPGTSTVIVIDSTPLHREALTARLASERDFRAIACDSHAHTVGRLLNEIRSNAVVIDATTLSSDRYQLHEVIKSVPEPPVVVVLVAVEEISLVGQLLARGIHSAVLKSASTDELTSAIRWSIQGVMWISPLMLRDVLAELTHGLTSLTHPRLIQLTRREREVLQLMVDGLGRRETALRLCVSNDTVRTHVRTILQKLQVHSSTDAVAVARAAGMRPM